ncbi:MAG: alpha/beta hydrolase [Candidatus Aureabacteria bacterium]|nr:alpha/beta hydrolase [Candidatus Auribacterota bacterium]
MLKEIILKTEDSEEIYADWRVKGHENSFLLCHGFLQYKDSRIFRLMAEKLSGYFDVLSIDMRGHGKSSGVFTYGSREKYDVKAALDFLRGKYRKTYVMGFSLGASASLQAVLENKTADFLILVSPPSRFGKIFPRFWTRAAFRALIGSFGSGKKVRGFNIFSAGKCGTDIFSELTIPALIIYSDEDWVISKKHIRDIRKYTKPNVDFVEFAGSAHAEHIFEQNQEVFLKKLLNWIGRSGKNNFQEVDYEQMSHKQIPVDMVETPY